MLLQVPAGQAQLRQKDDTRMFDGSLNDPAQISASVRPTRSPKGSGKLSLLGIAALVPVPLNPAHSFGNAPQTPQAVIPVGVFPSPEASPVPSPTEISLSSVSCIQNPIFGIAADPQKLAASWVSNQQYGEAAHQVQQGCASPSSLLANAQKLETFT